MAYGKKPGKFTRILGPSPPSFPGLVGLTDKRPGTIRRILAPSPPPCPGESDESALKERPVKRVSPPSPGSGSTKDLTDDGPMDLTGGPRNGSLNGGLSQHLRSAGIKELDNDNRTEVPDGAAEACLTQARPCKPQPQHKGIPTSPGPHPRSRPGSSSDCPFGPKIWAIVPPHVLAGPKQPCPDDPSSSPVHTAVPARASVSSLNQPSDTTGPDSMDEDDEEEEEEEDSCSEYDNMGSDTEGLEQDVVRMDVRYSANNPDLQEDRRTEPEDGLYLEHDDGTYVECEDRNYIEREDGAYEEYEDGAYIEHEDGTYVRLEDGTYVEYVDGAYVEGEEVEEDRNTIGQYSVPRPAEGAVPEQMHDGGSIRQETNTDTCTSPQHHHQFRDIPHQAYKTGDKGEREEVEGEEEIREVEGEEEPVDLVVQEETGKVEAEEVTGKVEGQEETGKVEAQEVIGKVEGPAETEDGEGREETEEERDVTTYSDDSEETEEETPSSHQGNGGTREGESEGEKTREGEREREKTREGESMCEGQREQEDRMEDHTAVSRQGKEVPRRERQSQADGRDRVREDVEVCMMGNQGDTKTSRHALESPQRTSCRVSGGGRDCTPQRAHKEVKRQGRGGRRDTRFERGGGREMEREDGVGQMVSDVKVCMSSSSSSETQDGREAATRPRPPRPRPRPRPNNQHPHQLDPHSQQAKGQSKTRPKQAYQTHTYLTEADSGPAPAQNLEQEAQGEARQNQRTKAHDCGDDAVRSRPRPGPNAPHPHLFRPKQVHQARNGQPEQTRKRQAPTHPTQAQTSLDHTRQTRGHTQPTSSPPSTSDSPPGLQNPAQVHGTSTRSSSDSPPSLQNQAQLHGTTSVCDSPPRLHSQAQWHGTSIRSTSDSPPSLQNQIQLNGVSASSTSASPLSKAQTCPSQVQEHDRERLAGTRPASVSPPSHKAQVQDPTPHTRHTQNRCSTSTSRSATTPEAQLYPTETGTQEQPHIEGPISPGPNYPPVPEKHPEAVNISALPSSAPRYKTTPAPPAPPYSVSPSPPSPAPCYKVCPSPPPTTPHYKTSPAPPAPQRGTETRGESPERRRADEQIPQHVTEEQPCRPPYPEPEETDEESNNTPQSTQNNTSFPSFVDVPGPCEPEDLIDGIIFAANYLGSTQLMSDKNPSKGIRMAQAHEAVSQVKSQDEDSQLVTEVDLFISTKAVKVLNADTQETLMDSALRTISYIADIGSIVVLMARTRRSGGAASQDCTESDLSSAEGQRQYRMICYVFESEDAQLIAQSIGQAFSVAYREFLRANGINPKDLSQKQYSDIINSQEMYNDDLVHFSNSDNCKELELEKQKGESLGVVIVESGWGSILPTVILANMLNTGPAARSGKLNVGDQIMSINNTSLVGLPLATCQSIIKGLKSQVQVKLSIVSCPPVTTVLIKRPDLKFQLGFSVQNGIICSLMRGGIAERGGVRVGHRIIEINGQSVVAMPHEKIVQTLSISVGEINMKTMPAVMFRLLTGQETPVYI
ncbi:hypothetical protein DPEC_G00160160 [Dallia pectoralis]|uniref:Uncharacterized protein n=1 Tax=Dallia pectoralis TaxID=75939 RepID=A0ACC2GG08_DALPE|nr:hypothetical protein DPEC_G00160160 [Dallia pectoralis]